MQRRSIIIVKIALCVFGFVAARPYLQFLVLPPVGRGVEWLVTVVALAVSVGLYGVLRGLSRR